MESTFEVNGKNFRVDFSLFGFEKYYYDGNLLLKRWSFKFKDRVVFECDSKVVEIDVSVSMRDWSMRAIVDGVVEVEELFPAHRDRMYGNRNNPPATQVSWLKLLVSWLAIAACCYAIFQNLQRP